MVALHEESETIKLGCDVCDSGDLPANRCTTCSHFLCEFCTRAHQRARNTRSHNLVSLEEAKEMGSAAVIKPAICKEHDGEVMKLFCDTCEEAICRDCTMVKHRFHKYTFVKDAFSKGKESLLKTLADTKGKADVLQKAVKSVLDMKRSVHSQAVQTKQEVVECRNELLDCITARSADLINRVEEFKDAKLKSLNIQQEGLETALTIVQSSVEFTEKAVENGSEVEILNMRKQMSSRLQELNSATWQLEPSVNECVSFTGNVQLLKDGIAAFGDVSDVVTNARMSTVTMEHGPEDVMYSSLCGQPVKFSIIAKESNGRKRKEGGDIFSAFVCPIRRLRSVQKEHIPVKDCGNGTYYFCHTPIKAGVFELSVHLKGSHVLGSPFRWSVGDWKLQEVFYADSVGKLILSEDQLTASYTNVEDDVNVFDVDDYDDGDDDVVVAVVDDDDGDDDDDDDDDDVVAVVDDDVVEVVDDDVVAVVDDDVVEVVDDPEDRRLYAVGMDSLVNGGHLWKIQIHSETFQGFSFGVIKTYRRNGRLVNLGSKWVWSSKVKEYTLPSGAQRGAKSSITDCQSGDIIELYLDLEGRKLRMHNPRTKQSDTWDGVSGEVSPVFHLANNGDKVSLKVPH